jgi:hypothetical protein
MFHPCLYCLPLLSLRKSVANMLADSHRGCCCRQVMASDSSSLLEVRAAAADANSVANVAAAAGSTDHMDRNAAVVQAAVAEGAIARLELGAAAVAFSLRPTFARVSGADHIAVLAARPAIIVRGIDAASSTSARMMVSPPIPVALATGAAVCPPGYVLSLDLPSPGDGSRFGGCALCGPGTYSLDPLASGTGGAQVATGGNSTAAGGPRCLACPAGGDCSAGGAAVYFVEGKWVAAGGMYRLVGCPEGHQVCVRIPQCVMDTRACAARATAEW